MNCSDDHCGHSPVSLHRSRFESCDWTLQAAAGRDAGSAHTQERKHAQSRWHFLARLLFLPYSIIVVHVFTCSLPAQPPPYIVSLSSVILQMCLYTLIRFLFCVVFLSSACLSSSSLLVFSLYFQEICTICSFRLLGGIIPFFRLRISVKHLLRVLTVRYIHSSTTSPIYALHGLHFCTKLLYVHPLFNHFSETCALSAFPSIIFL